MDGTKQPALKATEQIRESKNAMTVEELTMILRAKLEAFLAKHPDPDLRKKLLENLAAAEEDKEEGEDEVLKRKLEELDEAERVLKHELHLQELAEHREKTLETLAEVLKQTKTKETLDARPEKASGIDIQGNWVSSKHGLNPTKGSFKIGYDGTE